MTFKSGSTSTGLFISGIGLAEDKLCLLIQMTSQKDSRRPFVLGPNLPVCLYLLLKTVRMALNN